ncbi:MAG: MliC family protein [Accumulibacter sp.]|jgi:membrane-bound inhibitor of C-type lysozyme|uniref:MliC family protein n=1 Tax=Accumulibacter sp. TaxID=2053492 RepID=UPI0033149D7E
MQTGKMRLTLAFIASQALLGCATDGASGHADVLSVTSWTLVTSDGQQPLRLSAADDPPSPMAKPGQSPQTSTMLLCGSRRVRLAPEGDTLQLRVGDEVFTMHPTVSASGARYVAALDSTTSLWSKGDRATLVIRGQTYPECTPMPALPKRPGSMASSGMPQPETVADGRTEDG